MNQLYAPCLQETLSPRIAAARLLVFAADHGVTLSHPGVSAYPRTVSASIYRAIARGHAASATLCRASDCSLHVVDVGLDAPPYSEDPTAGLRDAGAAVQASASQVRRGSRDMLVGPAMVPEEAAGAMAVGRAAVRRYLAQMSIVKLSEPASAMALCIGELGIGNTTAASALLAALTGRPPEHVCGAGTGLDAEGVRRKAAAVEQALKVNAASIEGRDPQKVLQAVGGLELAAMVGAYLEASKERLPVLVDGFVSGVAALVAIMMDANVAKSLFWSHHSDEKGTAILMEAVTNVTGVKTQPALSMGLRLGEGTGAVLALPLLRSACRILKMATLEEALSAEKDKAAETERETGKKPKLASAPPPPKPAVSSNNGQGKPKAKPPTKRPPIRKR